MNHLSPNPSYYQKQRHELFENSQRYSQVKVHHRTGVNDTGGKLTSGCCWLANLPPVHPRSHLSRDLHWPPVVNLPRISMALIVKYRQYQLHRRRIAISINVQIQSLPLTSYPSYHTVNLGILIIKYKNPYWIYITVPRKEVFCYRKWMFLQKINF
jgi:hypothetical protein